MKDDNITEPEALGVLKGGRVESRDLISGSWRYRITATRVWVVVAFDSVTRTAVVTAWRKKP